MKRTWTKRELSILRQRFETTPNSVLAKELGHSVQSVQTTAMKKLGLHKKPFWTRDKVRQLRLLYPHSFLRELSTVFGITQTSISCKARQLRLKKATPYRERLINESHRNSRIHRGCHEWTEKENGLLRARYANEMAAVIAKDLGLTKSQVYIQAHKLGLKKNPEFLRAAGRNSARHPNVIRRQFKHGHKTWNAGMKGLRMPGSEKGWFKKGHKPQTWKPIGSMRIMKGGYLQIKVTDTGYTPRDYRAVHVLVWEMYYGPVPPGYIVIFKDGNRRNFDISNLECISRQQHAENTRQKDEYIAHILSHVKGGKGKYDRRVYRYLLDERRDLIEAKRKQLALNRMIGERKDEQNL